MTYFIESDKHWRISKSGYSIKAGWADNSRIICSYPFAHLPGKLDLDKFRVWLSDAERICDLHNKSIENDVTMTDEGDVERAKDH